MEKETIPGNSQNIHKVVFILSLLAAGYWWFGKFFDVYKFAVIGAVAELLWLPALFLLIALPIVALVLWIRDKFAFNLLLTNAFLFCTVTLLALIWGR